MPNNTEYRDGLAWLWERLSCNIPLEKRLSGVALIMVIGGFSSIICFVIPMTVVSLSIGSTPSKVSLPWFLFIPLKLALPILIGSITISGWLLLVPPKPKD